MFKTPYGFGEGKRTAVSGAECRVRNISDMTEIRRKFRDLLPNRNAYADSGDEVARLDVPSLFLETHRGNAWIDWYIGHFIGKQAIRVRDRLPFFRSLHSVDTSGDGVTTECGRLLHFNAYCAEKFVRKYQSFAQHPTFFKPNAPVDRSKLLLRDFINSVSFREATTFYNRTIATSPRKRDIIRERWSWATTEIPTVLEWLRQSYGSMPR